LKRIESIGDVGIETGGRTIDIQECYRLLELPNGASLSEIERSFKELAKVWHPDRFPDGSELWHRANAKLKQLNDEYSNLKSNVGSEQKTTPNNSMQTPKPAATTTVRPKQKKPDSHFGVAIVVAMLGFVGIVAFVAFNNGSSSTALQWHRVTEPLSGLKTSEDEGSWKVTFFRLPPSRIKDWETGFVVQVKLRNAVEGTHLRHIAIDDFEVFKRHRPYSSSEMPHTIGLVNSNGYLWNGKTLVKLQPGHSIKIRDDSFEFWLLFASPIQFPAPNGYNDFSFQSNLLQSSATLSSRSW